VDGGFGEDRPARAPPPAPARAAPLRGDKLAAWRCGTRRGPAAARPRVPGDHAALQQPGQRGSPAGAQAGRRYRAAAAGV